MPPISDDLEQAALAMVAEARDVADLMDRMDMPALIVGGVRRRADALAAFAAPSPKGARAKAQRVAAFRGYQRLMWDAPYEQREKILQCSMHDERIGSEAQRSLCLLDRCLCVAEEVCDD